MKKLAIFKELIGIEFDLLDLSNKLVSLGCEDIYQFGNMQEVLDSGVMIIAVDEYGENHIRIDFKVTIWNGKDESVNACYIVIDSITEF